MSTIARPVSRTFLGFRLGWSTDAMLPWLGVGLTLVLFEVLSRVGALPADRFPPITSDFSALASELQHAEFWSALGSTMAGWSIGMLIASAIAMPLGMLIGSNEKLYLALKIPIEFARPIPSVALIPLVVLVFGPTLDMKVFLVAFGAFFPILFQGIYGMRDIDPMHRTTARAFKFSRVLQIRNLTIPSVAPYLATGVRISSAIALILAVTTELVVGVPGLGTQIGLAENSGNYPTMYGLIIATGLLGWGLNAIFTTAESRLMSWHVAHRSVQS